MPPPLTFFAAKVWRFRSFFVYLQREFKIYLMNYRIAYIIYCIRKFAERFGITVKESFDYLHKYKGIEFLDCCYEAEHTLSFDDAVDDLTAVCLKHGGNLS